MQEPVSAFDCSRVNQRRTENEHMTLPPGETRTRHGIHGTGTSTGTAIDDSVLRRCLNEIHFISGGTRK